MKLLKQKIYRKNQDADADRLLKIVKVNNDRISQGERSPIVIGHTPGEDATKFLTLDVGSQCNFQTDGEFVYSDWDIDDAFEEAVKRHRGKSIELWSDDVVYPLSLLSHNRPALELEQTKYSRVGEHETVTLPEPQEDDAMDVDAMKNLFAECLQSSDLAGAVKSLTDTVTQLSLQVASHGEQSEKLKWLFEEQKEEEELPQVEEMQAPDGKIDKNELDEGEAMGNPEKETPEVSKEEMALPSGTNTFVPNVEKKEMTEPDADDSDDTEDIPVKKKKYQEMLKSVETHRFEADTQKSIAESYGNQIKQVSEEKNATVVALATLQHKYSMLSRENELIRLANKYEFDVASEMKIVEKMNDDQYKAHKELVVVRYSKPPIGRITANLGELPKPIAPDTAKVTPQETVMKVVKYAREKKLDYKSAYKQVTGEDAP